MAAIAGETGIGDRAGMARAGMVRAIGTGIGVRVATARGIATVIGIVTGAAVRGIATAAIGATETRRREGGDSLRRPPK